MHPGNNKKNDSITMILLVAAEVLTYALSGGIRANYGLIWMFDIALCIFASLVSFRIRITDGE